MGYRSSLVTLKKKCGGDWHDSAETMCLSIYMIFFLSIYVILCVGSSHMVHSYFVLWRASILE